MSDSPVTVICRRRRDELQISTTAVRQVGLSYTICSTADVDACVTDVISLQWRRRRRRRWLMSTGCRAIRRRWSKTNTTVRRRASREGAGALRLGSGCPTPSTALPQTHAVTANRRTVPGSGTGGVTRRGHRMWCRKCYHVGTDRWCRRGTGCSSKIHMHRVPTRGALFIFWILKTFIRRKYTLDIDRI